MPRLTRLLPLSAVICTAAALASGCAGPTGGEPAHTGTRPDSVSAGIAASATPTTGASKAAPNPVVPADVEAVARAFAVAYAQRDATDGGDRSYADAGARAARFASGELAQVLAQQRPGQEAAWAALRAEQARQTVRVVSVVVPDGAPAATPASTLVRVGYVLTTTAASGPARHSGEHLALRLEHTADGWRVAALPWA